MATSPSGRLLEDPAREGIDLGLRLGVAEARRGRFGAVDAEGVLGDEAAVGGDEAHRAGILPQASRHGGDRVHDVVVPRPAREREPAGDRQGPVGARAPAPWPRSAPPTGSRSRGRCGRGRPRRRRPAPRAARPGQAHGRRRAEVVALARRGSGRGRPCRCAGTPSDRGHAERLGPLGGAEDHGRALLHGVVRVHPLRVREPDHPVVRAGGADLLGRVGLLDPGVRVGARHLAEAGPELGHRHEVLVEPPARC